MSENKQKNQYIYVVHDSYNLYLKIGKCAGYPETIGYEYYNRYKTYYPNPSIFLFRVDIPSESAESIIFNYLDKYRIQDDQRVKQNSNEHFACSLYLALVTCIKIQTDYWTDEKKKRYQYDLYHKQWNKFFEEAFMTEEQRYQKCKIRNNTGIIRHGFILHDDTGNKNLDMDGHIWYSISSEGFDFLLTEYPETCQDPAEKYFYERFLSFAKENNDTT